MKTGLKPHIIDTLCAGLPVVAPVLGVATMIENICKVFAHCIEAAFRGLACINYKNRSLKYSDQLNGLSVRDLSKLTDEQINASDDSALIKKYKSLVWNKERLEKIPKVLLKDLKWIGFGIIRATWLGAVAKCIYNEVKHHKHANAIEAI